MNKELKKRILSSIILLPIIIYLIIKGSFLFNFFILICFFISIYEWHMMTKNFLYKIFGLLFLILSFYTIYKIRNDFSNDYDYFLLIILVCVSTDIGGYIFGKIFKGPKISRISPNKTYSGMVGSFLLPIIVIFFFLTSKSNFEIYDKIIFLHNMNLFFTIFFISLVSQLGDFMISYLKRKSNKKDTGNLIPGHGGLLDRIDGIIFATIFYNLLIKANI